MWSVVRDDPVVRQFSWIRVRVNPGDLVNQATLASGGLGTRLIVHTHSFQVERWCAFEAAETKMETGRVRYGWRERESIIISGTYGDQPIRISIYRYRGLHEMWAALRKAGVVPASGPAEG